MGGRPIIESDVSVEIRKLGRRNTTREFDDSITLKMIDDGFGGIPITQNNQQKCCIQIQT